MTSEEQKNSHQYEKFIKEICQSEIVWMLDNEDGFAIADSNEFENEDGEPLGMICFWSKKSMAQDCAREDWEEYTPTEIKLSEFIENWCITMANQNIMSGPNFDEDMTGIEVDPLELILDIEKELNIQGKKIQLENYTQLEVLVMEVKKLLNE